MSEMNIRIYTEGNEWKREIKLKEISGVTAIGLLEGVKYDILVGNLQPVQQPQVQIVPKEEAENIIKMMKKEGEK